MYAGYPQDRCMTGDFADNSASSTGRSHDNRNGDRLGGQELLVAEMRRELRRWRIATINYGITYYVSRAVLLVATAVVAAQESLQGGSAQWLIGVAPLLALAAAILTALDTWLKPQQKWRGFMESRDLLADLMVQFDMHADIERARTEFGSLRARHRERNIF